MRIFGHHVHGCDFPWAEAPPYGIELREMLSLVLANQEKTMIDLTKLQAQVARLQADDIAALAAYATLRDQNKAAQAQLATVSQQLADLQAGSDTTAVQKSIDDVAASLGATADSVEASIQQNTAVPDLPPAAPAPAADPNAAG